MDLLTLAREHDLPPKWDRLLVVQWTPWEPLPDAFICPPPKRRDCCPACGSAEPNVTARGMVAHSPTLTRDQWNTDQENRRLLGSAAHKRPLLATWRLHAYRCQDCAHDQVWDRTTDTWWDLDPSDYGPDGSTDPGDTR